MGIAGPRLDRPTAVGEAGRPRAASLTVAAVVTVGLAVATGYVAGDAGLVLRIALPPALLVAGLSLVGRTRLGPQVVGHLLALAGGVGLFVAVLAAVALDAVATVGGLTLALAGVAAAWAALDAARLRPVLGSLAVSVLATVVGLATLVVVVAGGTTLAGSVTGLARTTRPDLSLVGFALLLGTAALTTRLALVTVPLARLAPRERREGVQAAVDRLRTTTRLLGLFAGLLLGVTAVLLGSGRLARLRVGESAAATALGWLSAPPVVGLLTGVAALAGFVAVLALAVRRLTGLGERAVGRLAAVVAGGCFALGVLGFVAVRGPLLGGGSAAGFGLAVLGPLATLVALGLVVGAASVGLVPDRAGPGALAAGGLLVTAIGAGTSGVPPVLVFALVAGAMVVWDTATFGLGLTVELGHVPETRRLELVHAVVSVGLGAVAVLGLTGVEALRTAVAADVGGPAALVVAAVGVLLLLVPLRG
jgi:hypothetical protein